MSDTYSQFVASFKDKLNQKVTFDNGENDINVILDVLQSTWIKKFLDEYDNFKIIFEEVDMDIKSNNLVYGNQETPPKS